MFYPQKNLPQPLIRFRIITAILLFLFLMSSFVPAFGVCGDANGDERINLNDATFIIAYIFLGGPPPNPLEDSDVNCDGTINVSDAVYLLNAIFLDGPAPCAACP